MIDWTIVRTEYTQAHADLTQRLCELLEVPHRQLTDGRPPVWMTTQFAAQVIETFYRITDSTFGLGLFTATRPSQQEFRAFASLVALGADDAALISFLL